MTWRTRGSRTGITTDKNQLTLKGASPDILFFCDRPERTAGHLRWDAFMKLVADGDNSFADAPPNAAVSVIDDQGEVTEVIVTLTEQPTKRGDEIVFPMRVIDGELPPHGGPALLFIDPIGRPLSPGSMAGVHRRHRRRAIRRPNLDRFERLIARFPALDREPLRLETGRSRALPRRGRGRSPPGRARRRRRAGGRDEPADARGATCRAGRG